MPVSVGIGVSPMLNRNSVLGRVPLITDLAFTVNTSNPGTSTATQFTLALRAGGTYNCTIYWGDGTFTTQTTDVSPTHTYGSSGVKNIRIEGTFYGFHFNGAGDRRKITNISQWGNIVFGANQSNAWNACSNLTITDSGTPTWSGVTNMEQTFMDCSSLGTSTIGSWDVSAVTNMLGTFRNASLSTSLNSWNVSSVTTMRQMFRGSSYNQIVSSWNVSSVTDMSEMFQSASFNRSLSTWNVGNVTTMQRMFQGASSATGTLYGSLVNWDVRKVTNMDDMFNLSNQTSLINVSAWQPLELTSATSFQASKSNGGVVSATLDAIYNAWSLLTLKPNVSIHFGNNKYSAASSAARAVLTGAPNNWTITDAGLG